MSGEPATEGVAADELRQFVDRIIAVHDEIDERNADKKEIYAELHGRGFDKTAVGALVREIRKQSKGGAKFQEHEAILDLYRQAYQGVASHTHTREAA